MNKMDNYLKEYFNVGYWIMNNYDILLFCWNWSIGYRGINFMRYND